jgi:ZIP family zinc transporter
MSLVLVPRGTRPLAAAWWSVFSSLPQPLLAVPAFVFVESFSAILPAGLGFATGAMVWVVLFELLPEARATASRRSVTLVLGLAFPAMMGLASSALAPA